MIVSRSVKHFWSSNTAASLLLFLCAIAAAIIANSSAAPAYENFLSHELHLQIGEFNLFSHGGKNLTMLEFINDGLMTIFFLSVGLEIKRELLVGELASFRKAILPFIAASGGMLIPVILYSLIASGYGSEVEMRGLAIPMATDIAFSLGVLSLFGKRVPLSLKIFLTAFAVVDDIGGILVIAIYYSSHVSLIYLLGAVALYAMLYVLGRKGMISQMFFMLTGVVIWYLFLQSGIHSTISGVILAFVIPAKPQLNAGKYIEQIRRIIHTFPTMSTENIVLNNKQIAKLKQVEWASDRVISPLQSLEDNLHNSVNYIILPLFAFVNAGVVMSGGGEIVGTVTYAVAIGLIFGKFIGIYSFTWLSIKSGLIPMPEGMNWRNLAGIALLGGIGFTVSLFITNLSYSGDFPNLLNQAKLGVLSGTLIAGILGALVLHWTLPKRSVKVKARHD